jgi:NAD(P)-dependent dehydrogenase (short-subunit alcohol dehydrogenase family)
MRLVLPIMRAQSRGRIVNVTSGAAHGTAAFVSAYGSANQALDALTASVDLEASPFGVPAVSVVPGTYPTTPIKDNIVMAPVMGPYGQSHVKLFDFLKRIR